MGMPRSNELKTGLWRVYFPKRGKLAGLVCSYPPKPILYFKNEAEGLFPIVLGFIHSEIMSGGRN